MKLNELYKKVRREQEVSLDEDSMWNAIESRLEKPKKKRRFIWLWFSISVILIGTYVGLVFDSESIHKENLLIENNNLITETPMDSSPVLTSLKLDNNTLKTNEKGESIYKKTKGAHFNENKITIDSKIDNTNDIVEVVNHEMKKSIVAGYEYQQETTKKIKASSSSSISDNLQNIRSNRINNRTSNVNNLMINNLPIFSYSKIACKNNKVGFGSMPTVELKSKAPLINEERKMKAMLELSFSLDYLNPRSIIAEKDPLLSTWSELHSKSKSSISSFQLSTILKYRHRSGIGVGSGMIFRQVNEWYDAQVETFIPIEIPSDSAEIAIVNGAQEYKSGVLTGTRIERTNYHTPIRRFYIDIPLEVSYIKTWSKLDVELSMSYNINISHKYYGRSYGDEQVLLDQNQLDFQGVYKNNLVNSTNFGLKLNHHLTSNMSVGLSFNYWHQLYSSLDANSSLNEHYRGIGGGLNIKRTFTY